jgi:hypothetical protein
MHLVLAKDLFTISCAVIGAVLGVINTWQGLNQRRVRLKVVPKVASIFYGRKFDQEMGCVEVTNLSAFPVTLREVGFTNGDPRKKERAVIVKPIVHDAGPWPRRLESRASVSVYFDWGNLKRNIKRAYVLTDCGEVGYGNSPALESMIKRLPS